MKLHLRALCPICGKPKGHAADHSKCSPILQAQYQAKQKPLTWEGKEGTRVITPEQARLSRGRRAQKAYASGKFKAPKE